MKDAKGHGSDSRGGVSGQVTAVKGLVNMIRPPAAHQEGIRQGVPMWRGTKFGLYQTGDVIQIVPRFREEHGDVAFSGQRFKIKPAKDPTK